MAVGTATLELFAGPLCSVFQLSGLTERLCISAVRIISIGFIFAGVSISLQGVFQALDCGTSSLVISLCRQLVFILPVVWALTRLVAPDLGNAWIVWLAFPIAEIVSGAIAEGLMFRVYQEKIEPLQVSVTDLRDYAPASLSVQ